jgi:hypothetical protein
VLDFFGNFAEKVEHHWRESREITLERNSLPPISARENTFVRIVT